MGLRDAAKECPRNRFLRRSSISRFHRFHGIVSAMAAHSSATTNTTGWFKTSCMAHWYSIRPKLTSPNPRNIATLSKLAAAAIGRPRSRPNPLRLVSATGRCGRVVYCGRTARTPPRLRWVPGFFWIIRMLESLSVRTFKSLEDVTVELGMVNVFIGANGSGKSNLLEAMGVLSAAADGKVDDQSLLARGVRPGVPRLYKSAFPATRGEKIPSHISFGAYAAQAKYEVSLHNPLKDPAPAWRFKTEYWEGPDGPLVGRSPATKKKGNPDRGMAALRAVDVTHGDALDLLKLLHGYVIFFPTTPVLRGVAPETQPRQPLGLSGGDLPRAILELLKQRRQDEHSQRVCRDVLGLVDWAASFGAGSAGRLPLSPAAASTDTVIRFRDRFMRKDRSLLSGYDASEGALYALFLAVVSGHEESPSLCAVDNADHSSSICAYGIWTPASRVRYFLPLTIRSCWMDCLCRMTACGCLRCRGPVPAALRFAG